MCKMDPGIIVTELWVPASRTASPYIFLSLVLVFKHTIQFTSLKHTCMRDQALHMQGYTWMSTPICTTNDKLWWVITKFSVAIIMFGMAKSPSRPDGVIQIFIGMLTSLQQSTQILSWPYFELATNNLGVLTPTNKEKLRVRQWLAAAGCCWLLALIGSQGILMKPWHFLPSGPGRRTLPNGGHEQPYGTSIGNISVSMSLQQSTSISYHKQTSLAIMN